MSDPAVFDEFDTQVSTAIGRYNAAGAELVDATVRCIAEGWWQIVETHSPEHWLMARCGLDRRRAHQLVRIARAIESFPATAAAFAAGQLTEDHVSVIVGCDPAADADLAACAPSCNVHQLRRLARAHPKPADPPPETAADDGAPDANDAAEPVADHLSFGWNEAGRLEGYFNLGVAAGSLVEQALRSARGVLFRERTGLDPDDEDNRLRVRAIHWADALERLGLAGLDGLDPATAAGSRPGDRYQVLLHLDADHPERSRLGLGPLLSAADRRLLSCDADVRSVLWRGGRPVSLGRRRRVADPLLRALIEDRDGGCRVCGATGLLHIHHLVHWEDGGPTDDDNLVALCTACHRSVHHGAIRIVGDPTRVDGLVFLDRTGRPRPAPGGFRAPVEPAPARPYLGPIRGERIDYRFV